MQPQRFLSLASAAVAATIVLTGCGGDPSGEDRERPVLVESIPDSELKMLTLTQSAADRLNIQTSTVEVAAEGWVVPSAAVIIDATGTYWVYTNPEPLVFVRKELGGVYEKDLHAFFERGPEAGTPIVTLGVPELYGAEFGIGK